MSRGPCNFRQRDIKAALKAARDAGFDEARVEIDPVTRRLTVVAVNLTGQSVPSKRSDRNEWDDV